MSTQRTIITAKGRRGLGLKELFRYKDLFFILAYRDFRVRYAQTALGLIWAILQPIATVAIFSIVFGRLLSVQIPDGMTYRVYALSGMVGWTYFAFVLTQSGQSLISSQDMIKKIYFPRIIIPVSKAVVGFVDLFITMLLLIALMLFDGVTPSWNIVWLPAFILVIIITSLGVGIWMSALTIRFRDFQHIVPFMVQIGLYATPVAYPASMIAEKYHWLYYMNPMAGVVEGFRWCILGTDPPTSIAYLSFGMAALIFVTGVFYFKRMEKIMADLV